MLREIHIHEQLSKLNHRPRDHHIGGGQRRPSVARRAARMVGALLVAGGTRLLRYGGGVQPVALREFGPYSPGASFSNN